MSMMKILLLLSVAISLTCCDELTPGDLAKSYCKCMEKNLEKHDFTQSKIMCDGVMVNKSEKFRLSHIEITYGGYMKNLPDSIVEINRLFFIEFYDSLYVNCCPLVHGPPCSH